MLLSPTFLDELRHRTLLSALIGRGLKLQKAGREYKACCPFHQEKSASFYVNDDKGFYHCFGCSAHGDAIKWLTEAKGLPFMDAVKELAGAAGMELPAPDRQSMEREEKSRGLVDVVEAAASWFADQLNGIAGSGARAYLDQRGITQVTRDAFGLGFAPDSRSKLKAALSPAIDKGRMIEAGLLIQPEGEGAEPYDRFRGRLMIPIRDQRGRAIAFGGRIIGDGEPKYLNSPETPLFDKGRTLFNLDRAAPAARKAGRVLVVEGYLDAIALDQAGIGEVVAPLGTALTEAQMERLWRLADVPVLCFDGDKAGQKAAVRAALRALPLVQPGRTLRFALLPEGQDPDDIVRSGGGAKAFETVLAGAISLDELIWRHELGETPALDTPEDRAGLGKRLRDLARTIGDDGLKREYLAEFNRRLYEHFDSRREERWKGQAKRGQTIAALPPELRRIREFGIDVAVTAPAILRGLIRHPALIAKHAETLGRLKFKERRELRQVQVVMLEAGLTEPQLDSARIETILKDEGLGPSLDTLNRTNLAFSFLRGNAPAETAERDLSDVIDQIVAHFEVRAELAAATRKVGEDGDGATFDEQQRLVRAERELRDAFSALVLDRDGANF